MPGRRPGWKACSPSLFCWRHTGHALCRIVIHSNLYPITPLLPFANRIITACGFNLMRQTAAYREQHRFLPFPRHLDDQFLRAARHRLLPHQLAPPDIPVNDSTRHSRYHAIARTPHTLS